MISVQCENYLTKHSDYLDHVKVIHDRSASTISDCYSSDDDYKEGILHDYFLNQSTVLLSHEAVAFNGDQREFENKGFSNNMNTERKGDEESNKSYKEDVWKTENYTKILRCNSNLYSSSSSINQESPDYILEKCVSEFYRPPSRPKINFLGNTTNFDEDLSNLQHNYTESDKPMAYLKSSLYKENVQLNKEVGENCYDNDASASLFNPITQFQECKTNPHDDSTIKLMSITSLNSHTESGSEGEVIKILNSKKELLEEYQRSSICYSELECTHSGSSKKSNTVPFIKSTTAQCITNGNGDNNYQSKSHAMHTEKFTGTNLISETVNTQKEMKLHNGSQESEDFITNFHNKSTNLIKYLPDILSILQHHVNKIVVEVSKIQKNTETPISLNNGDTMLDSENCSSPNEKGYPDYLVNTLFTQIRQMYFQLDSKIKYPVKKTKLVKHKRHFSEVSRNRNPMYASGGDIECSPESFLGMSRLKDKLQNSRVKFAPSINNCESDVIHLQESKEESCRIFELNPYDDLVKSYQSHSDRRIKAVGNKMKCKIIIEGPIRIFDSTNGCWNMRNKIAYRCSLSGSTKEVVEKCLKCLQDTFPQSCLNEKHVISKFENRQLIS